MVTAEATCRIPSYKLGAKVKVSSFIHLSWHKKHVLIVSPNSGISISPFPFLMAGSSFLSNPRG